MKVFRINKYAFDVVDALFNGGSWTAEQFEAAEEILGRVADEQRERDAARLERAILTIVAGDVLGSTVKEALHGIAKAIRDDTG